MRLHRNICYHRVANFKYWYITTLIASISKCLASYGYIVSTTDNILQVYPIKQAMKLIVT